MPAGPYGVNALGKVIIAFVIAGLAIVVQQVLTFVISVSRFARQYDSFEVKGGMITVNDDRQLSLMEIPLAGPGLLWGSVAGSLIILVAGYFLGSRSWRRLGFSGFTLRAWLPWLGAFFLFGMVAHYLERHFPEFRSEDMETMIRASLSSPVMVFLGIGILAPIFEELVFRGLLFEHIANLWGGMVAVIITALIFTVIHLQYNAYILSALVILAFILGMMRLRTGSIWPSTIIHVVNNCMSVWLIMSET